VLSVSRGSRLLSLCVWPTAAALVSQIYARFKDEDGFLYIVYSGENTFGAADTVDERTQRRFARAARRALRSLAAHS